MKKYSCVIYFEFGQVIYTKFKTLDDLFDFALMMNDVLKIEKIELRRIEDDE